MANAPFVTLPAGAVVFHDGRAVRLMHATQVVAYRFPSPVSSADTAVG